MIDLYCERIDSGFWAEPVNVFTSICFIFTAWFSWRFAVHKQARDSSTDVLNGLIVTIAIGSVLFHSMATSFAQWLDIIPIFAFQLLYIGLYARRVIVLSVTVSGTLLLVFLAAVFYASQFTDVFNGTLIYAPTLLVMLVLGLYHYQSKKVARNLLLGAAGLFLLSLFFRSIDNLICNQFVLGSHFLWHILNAMVIYLAMRALISNLPPAPISD